MAVDLSDLLDNIKSEVNAPGLDQLPGATDTQYLENLKNAFWEGVLDGVISGYTESDGIVTPDSGTTEFSRELQQLVIFYAGYRIVRNQMRDLKTVFRAKAGPVEYETQQAATVLKAILDELKSKRSILLERLSDLGVVDSFYVDAIISRDDSYAYGDGYWVS